MLTGPDWWFCSDVDWPWLVVLFWCWPVLTGSSVLMLIGLGWWFCSDVDRSWLVVLFWCWPVLIGGSVLMLTNPDRWFCFDVDWPWLVVLFWCWPVLTDGSVLMLTGPDWWFCSGVDWPWLVVLFSVPRFRSAGTTSRSSPETLLPSPYEPRPALSAESVSYCVCWLLVRLSRMLSYSVVEVPCLRADTVCLLVKASFFSFICRW